MSNNLISPLTSVTNPVPATTPQPFVFASFKRRLVAYLIDFMFLFIIQQVIIEILGFGSFSRVMSAQTVAELSTMQKPTTQLALLVLGIAICYAYYAFYYISRGGATPGKKILGIKLVRADGAPITFGTVLVRILMALISGLCLSLGYIWAAFDPKHQTWHDKAANTYVVHSDLPARKGLGIFLAILSMLIYSIYISVIFIKSFSLGLSEGMKKKNIQTNSTSYNMQERIMSPEVQKIVDSSQVQFNKIRATTNAAEVKPLADHLIIDLKSALTSYPDQAVLWNQLSSAYTWDNSFSHGYEESIVAQQKAIELEPNNAMYIAGLGQLYINLQRYSEAVIELKKSLRLEESAFTYSALGEAYAGLDLKDDAKANYTKALSQFEAHNRTGNYDVHILNIKKALNALK